MQAPASANEYPKDPELEQNIDESKKPSERKETKDIKENIESSKVKESEIPSDEKKSESLENSSSDNNEFDLKSDSKPDAPSAPKKPFGMGLGIGSATLDGTLYNLSLIHI